MLRWLTAGESHGPALTAILEGLPAGVQITTEDLVQALARRRLGYGRGARMSFERDEVSFRGGLRHGVSLGGPIAIEIANTEWPKWETVMATDPLDETVLAGQARNAPLTRPRPGHADLTGMQKYGFGDARPVLERASARETAARVALGTVASAFLEQTTGARLVSHVVSLGQVNAPADAIPSAVDRGRIDADPVRCFDPEAAAAMVAEVDTAKREGDTLGGVVEVVVEGLPPGLGSFTHWDRRLDGRLAAALMGIQAIKAVEVGDGFASAARRGSVAHDEIVSDAQGLHRVTGRAGGIEGGMSTGEVLRVRAAMKPISTVPKALATVDVATGEAASAINQRSDVCAVPAAGVVAESMVALILADAVLEKFGGDSVAETARNVGSYLENLSFQVSPQGGMPPQPVVVLVGAPGAGKSTVGRVLARVLGVAFRDTDRDVERIAGKAVSDIFVDDGEDHFRRLESAAVATALAEHDGVLALGGGAILEPQTRALLAGHRVVWLKVDVPAAAKRVGLARDRPLLALNPRAHLRELLAARAPLYAAVATEVIDASEPSVAAIVEQLRRVLSPVVG